MADFSTYDYPAKRSKRTRKKRILHDLMKQISFYFSDSNLCRDKYLSLLTLKTPEGYVPIDTIAGFTRIQELECDRKLLVKAMSLIPELELSPDGTMIRRRSAINFQYNADDRSIYIENIPPRFDHKRLEQVLSKYGTIMHISLPRYRNNNEFKGFGFIEFKTVAETKAALKGLGWEDKDGETAAVEAQTTEMKRPQSLRLSTSVTNTPTKGTPEAPGVYSETEAGRDSSFENKKKRRRRRSSICISELKSAEIFEPPQDPLLALDNKGDGTSTRKRKKTSIDTVSPVNNKVRRLTSMSSCSESEQKDVVSGPSESQIKKKLKLVKAKNRKKRKQKEKQKEELLGIRVFPKSEWLKLKRTYKNLQKKQISAIKKDLGMKPKSGNVIKLSGSGITEDSVRSLFSDAVIAVYSKSDHCFVKFCTNPDSYKSATLPEGIQIEGLTDAEKEEVNSLVSGQKKQRYEDRRRNKIRGYMKVIKKCSAQDQTSH